MTASRTDTLVVACGRGPAPTLAQQWATAGRNVALITDGSVPAQPGLTPIGCAFDSAAAVQHAFALAAGTEGGPAEVVISVLPAAALACADLATLPFAAWQAATHGGVRPLLYCLQAVAALAREGCAVTVLGPNVSLTGAAGLVALCTAVEGQRSLAKAAARQLGARDIRINWLALAATVFDPAFADMALPAVPELGPPPPALNRSIDLESDVLPALAFLGSHAARGITGQMLNLDGGDWMLP